MLNPTHPTQITAVADKTAAQRVTIDPRGWTPADEADALLYFAEAAELAIYWSAAMKARALAAKVKCGRGKIAEGNLKLASAPRVPVTAMVLRAIADKAKADKKDLLEALLEMQDAITFGKKKLEDHFGKNELDGLCADGDPPAPSMPVTPRDGEEAGDPLEALRNLVKLAKEKPRLFKIPEKGKKVDGPRQIYVWGE